MQKQNIVAKKKNEKTKQNKTKPNKTKQNRKIQEGAKKNDHKSHIKC